MSLTTTGPEQLPRELRIIPVSGRELRQSERNKRPGTEPGHFDLLVHEEDLALGAELAALLSRDWELSMTMTKIVIVLHRDRNARYICRLFKHLKANFDQVEIADIRKERKGTEQGDELVTA